MNLTSSTNCESSYGSHACLVTWKLHLPQQQKLSAPSGTMSVTIIIIIIDLLCAQKQYVELRLITGCPSKGRSDVRVNCRGRLTGRRGFEQCQVFVKHRTTIIIDHIVHYKGLLRDYNRNRGLTRKSVW